MKNNRGMSLVEITVIIAIIALLGTVLIPKLLNARRSSNEAGAKAAVLSLSTAVENYAVSHNGKYPVSVDSLKEYFTSAGEYCVDLNGKESEVMGYRYACTANNASYIFTATPLNADSGRVNYSASTGGVLTSS